MGTLVGFLIFFTLLLLAVQVLVHLYATSSLTSAAYDAARQVADSPSDESAEVPLAEAAARRDLGSFGDRTTFDWEEADGRQVVLQVVADSPGFLPLPESFRRIERTVTVRVERFR